MKFILKFHIGLQVGAKDRDTLNNIITKLEYDEKCNKNQKIFTNKTYKEFKYNEKNLLTETIYYDEEGIRTLKTEYTYDGNDKLTLMIDKNLMEMMM